jgi:hypothetical protein
MNGRWNRFDVDEGVRRGVGWSWSWETGGEGNRRAGRAEREGGGEFWSPTNHFRVYQIGGGHQPLLARGEFFKAKFHKFYNLCKLMRFLFRNKTK